MENEKIEAKLQYKGNYVKDFKINILNKNVPKKRQTELELQVGISNFIIDKQGYKNAQLTMTKNIKILSNEKEIVDMHIEMVGLFMGSIGMSDEQLNHMLKVNGAPMLSQAIRAYITAVTALSGIDAITLPMFNFNNLFTSTQVTDKKI